MNKHLGTQLLASRSATEGVEGLVTRFVGEFRFVGKTEPLPILEILDREQIAGDSVLKLCKRFSEAMDVLKEGYWTEAGGLFEAILRDYPEDGPSRFHLARCRKFANAPPHDTPWVVHMDAK